MDYPCFSSFRELMTNCDEFFAEAKNNSKINALFDGHGFILFFKKGKDVYGSGEDSRVIFAKMKNPDDDLPSNWEEEASFSAYDLKKLLKGESNYHVFSKKDLKKIKVIDREKAVEILNKIEDTPSDTKIFTFGKKQDEPEPENFIRTDEK